MHIPDHNYIMKKKVVMKSSVILAGKLKLIKFEESSQLYIIEWLQEK